MQLRAQVSHLHSSLQCCQQCSQLPITSFRAILHVSLHWLPLFPGFYITVLDCCGKVQFVGPLVQSHFTHFITLVAIIFKFYIPVLDCCRKGKFVGKSLYPRYKNLSDHGGSVVEQLAAWIYRITRKQ